MLSPGALHAQCQGLSQRGGHAQENVLCAVALQVSESAVYV